MMSYARWSEGDVYVIHHADGYLICYLCPLVKAGEKNFTTHFRSDMLKHLEQHLKYQDYVPIEAIEQLRKEIELEGDEVEHVEF